jgi:glycosyltransferase involved in cell wall biosynthesis
MNNIHPPLSVVLSVYRGDDADQFDASLGSVTDEQTRPPDEVVVVADGPLTPALNRVLDGRDDVDVVRLEENRGAGGARAAGVEHASHELVAFQDADDLSVSERFERQLSYLGEHPEVDALGGYISEFGTDPERPHATREVPTRPSKTARWAKVRSPLNQTTVMARRQSILDAGNYHADARMEDYALWARMLTRGMVLDNVPEVLAKVRAGSGEMAGRRGGFEYAREDVRLQREFHRIGFVSAPLAALNVAVRVPTRLVPNRLRSAVYGRLLRD